MSNSSFTKTEFKWSMERLVESVTEFHDRFGIKLESIHSGNIQLPTENLKSRLAILVEEIGEHAKELNQDDYERAIEEMVDIAYILIGTLEIHRTAAVLKIEDVTRKNNSKTGDTHYLNEQTGKILRR